MTYKGNTYEDVITVEDKSDPYVSEMLSIGGFTVKNNLGGVVPYVIVRTNQKEVDPLLGSISETAPSNPEEGDFWYQVDHSAQTVTLMKYSGLGGCHRETVVDLHMVCAGQGWSCGGV